MTVEHRLATMDDCSLLAELNQRFLLEEGHKNVFLPALGPPDAIPLNRLLERMQRWLSQRHEAVVFSVQDQVVAYALYEEGKYNLGLQQFFVVPDRRRTGIGRRCFEVLRSEYWPHNKRISLEVLTDNEPAVAFWRAMGFRNYSLEMVISPDP